MHGRMFDDGAISFCEINPSLLMKPFHDKASLASLKSAIGMLFGFKNPFAPKTVKRERVRD